MDLEKQPLFEGVDCISMTVPNLEDGLAFYRDGLGMELLWQTEQSCGLRMQNGEAELVLTTSNNVMVDVKVADVEEALRTFVAAG